MSQKSNFQISEFYTHTLLVFEFQKTGWKLIALKKSSRFLYDLYLFSWVLIICILLTKTVENNWLELCMVEFTRYPYRLDLDFLWIFENSHGLTKILIKGTIGNT